MTGGNLFMSVHILAGTRQRFRVKPLRPVPVRDGQAEGNEEAPQLTTAPRFPFLRNFSGGLRELIAVIFLGSVKGG